MGFSNSPWGFLCAYIPLQQVRSGSILLRRFLHPDTDSSVLFIVVALFGSYKYTMFLI